MDHKPLYLTLLILALVFSAPLILCGGWSFYDGLVTYPQRIERYEVWEQTQQSQPDSVQAREAWLREASRRGWSPDTPERTTRMDIVTQYLMTATCGGLGLVLLLVAAVCAVLLARRPRQGMTVPG